MKMDMLIKQIHSIPTEMEWDISLLLNADKYYFGDHRRTSANAILTAEQEILNGKIPFRDGQLVFEFDFAHESFDGIAILVHVFDDGDLVFGEVLLRKFDDWTNSNLIVMVSKSGERRSQEDGVKGFSQEQLNILSASALSLMQYAFYVLHYELVYISEFDSTGLSEPSDPILPNCWKVEEFSLSS